MATVALPATSQGPVQGADVGLILATIRARESGGNYSAHNPAGGGGGASGAYQYIQGTWSAWANRAGFSQYANGPASAAPPQVQDAVAAANVRDILNGSGGKVAAVPMAWYTGNPNHGPNWACPGNECAQSTANGGLEPSTYVAGWMRTYDQISGGTYQGTTGSAQATSAQDLAQASTTGTVPGPGGITYKETCIWKSPSLNLGITSLGGGCVFGTSQARALMGAGLVTAGVLLSMAGMAVLTVALLGKPLSTAVSFVPGPVGKVAGAVGSATGSDRTRQRERPDRELPLGEQDKADLNTQLAAKRRQAEGPSEDELTFRRESRAQRRATKPRGLKGDADYVA